MKHLLTYLIILLVVLMAHSQNFTQSRSDSLRKVMRDSTLPDSLRINAMYDLVWDEFLFALNDSTITLMELQYNMAESSGMKKQMGQALSAQGVFYNLRGDNQKAMDFYSRALVLAKELGDKGSIAQSLQNIGSFYSSIGDYPKALNCQMQTLKLFEETGDRNGVGNTLGNIGIIYNYMDNIPMAMDYYERCLAIAEEVGDQQLIANTLGNMAGNYTSMGDPARALEYLTRSLKIYEDIIDIQGIAWINQNLGEWYISQHDYPKAMDHIQRGLKIFEEIGDKKGASASLVVLGNLYKDQNNRVKESEACLRALQLAREIHSFKEQSLACQCLYGSYKAMGKGDLALEYHELMLAISDSLQLEETTRQLERLELRQVMLKDSIAAVEKERLMEEAHKEEVRKKNQTRNILAGTGLLFLILAGGFYSRWHYIRKSKAVLQVEKDRSENLLLNILPEEIAHELKLKGKADARDFDMISILFTDFKGFTNASSTMSAQDLVAEINTCFEAFDTIVGKYKIEKIKTIGDAYMAAGGLPLPSNDSVKNTVHAAIEMQEFIISRVKAQHERGLPAFEMRVGIHTGPVVAGIVGVKKFQYDIWGDTVNTASRMESNGEVGKVNISQSTYELIRDDADFTFEARGRIEAKGKGELEMYFVSKTY